MITSIPSCLRASVSPPEARAMLCYQKWHPFALVIYGKRAVTAGDIWVLLEGHRWSPMGPMESASGSNSKTHQKPSSIAPSQLATDTPCRVPMDSPRTQQQPALFISRLFRRS